MVDTGTYSRMSSDEQKEFNKYLSTFIRAVLKSDATDGIEFEKRYTIQKAGNTWFISTPGSHEPFADIKIENKAVIEALFADTVQNYGR